MCCFLLTQAIMELASSMVGFPPRDKNWAAGTSLYCDIEFWFESPTIEAPVVDKNPVEHLFGGVTIVVSPTCAPNFTTRLLAGKCVICHDLY